ncbi:MBL fold metallo-hydrolase [uncultured Eudoraea sp.]|uniref:MBL fold metallo-hydrolase RNA specificity domain-containing protein n=1 Tax=uncultured Eudoraea sp. TaxID=1035614 RepID=UPI00262198A0|nr:MBL fold metallo-hydrolase [uncultured Eudoraea sp.]
MVKVHFLGASGTVTGSKFYLETNEQNILVDCGMFQGRKDLRITNRSPLPISVPQIDIVLLTHGHLDHTGYLPRLVKAGFKGKIVGTAPTLAITRIILLDSAKINEEEAELANSEGYSKHKPALPFYTIEDAQDTIGLFKAEELNQWIPLSENIQYRFRYNGHIIGSTFIELDIFGKRFVFSGDVGRPDDILLEAPVKPEWADFLFVESTYGNKIHPENKMEERLVELVKTTIYEKGILLIPSFAVERLQSLMYLFWQLYKKNKIPNIPIFVDSPMGANVLSIFERFPGWHSLSRKEYDAMCAHVTIIESYRETWETIDDPRPKIVIAGSGMVTGGRILTYLRQFLDRTNTSVLLVGYMAEGTRGRTLLEGGQELKIFGKFYPVKAHIYHEESLSAHADQKELLDWMDSIKNIPERVFLIHGEQDALDGFKHKITGVYNWNVHVPKLFETIELVF